MLSDICIVCVDRKLNVEITKFCRIRDQVDADCAVVAIDCDVSLLDAVYIIQLNRNSVAFSAGHQN